jgi:Zn-dependent M28 family amino/carboxypeptidase
MPVPCRFRDTLVLAAFDMEEIDLLGSLAAVPELTRTRQISEAIFFETMGYTSAGDAD